MVGENADHIIAGDGSVDAAHSKSFVYIEHTYFYSRSEELASPGVASRDVYYLYL